MCLNLLSTPPTHPPTHPAERDERERRKVLYACYLLRAPLWDTAVKPVASTVHAVLRPVPLVGGMASYAFMMLEYMQKHHFYTSGS